MRYALFLLDGNAIFYRQHEHQWQNDPIYGEAFNAVSSPFEMADLLDKQAERLNLSEQFATVAVDLFYSQTMSEQAAAAVQKLSQLNCQQFQCLAFEPFLATVALTQAPQATPLSPQISWFENAFLPLASQHLHQNVDQLALSYQQKEAKLQREMLQLSEEKARLLAAVKQFKAEIAALQTPDVAFVASFMPLFFENFWTHIKPTDFATLANSVEVLNIPSPFPEPDAFTLEEKRQDFLNLPDSQRQAVVAMAKKCQKQQALKVRLAMKNLI